MSWAATKGAKTGEVAEAILARGQHPESGRRACLKLVRLGERHGEARLEAACSLALRIGNPTVRSVEAILKNGLEKAALVEEVESKPVMRENIRGGEYFNRGEVASSREEEEIEARYLEEERQSIIHESRTDASVALLPRRREVDVQRDEGGHEVTNSTVVSAMATRREPLRALIGRAQALLSRPPVAKQSGRRTANSRRGEGGALHAPPQGGQATNVPRSATTRRAVPPCATARPSPRFTLRPLRQSPSEGGTCRWVRASTRGTGRSSPT